MTFDFVAILILSSPLWKSYSLFLWKGEWESFLWKGLIPWSVLCSICRLVKLERKVRYCYWNETSSFKSAAFISEKVYIYIYLIFLWYNKCFSGWWHQCSCHGTKTINTNTSFHTRNRSFAKKQIYNIVTMKGNFIDINDDKLFSIFQLCCLGTFRD